MNKVRTLTIVIPAYNEESNIGLLLRDLTKQKVKSAVVEQIIVLSDQSTDDTDSIVLDLAKKYPYIRLHKQLNRVGKGLLLNQALDKIDSDILVVFDADIRVLDDQTVEKLIQPILKKHADLTSAVVKEIETANWIQKALSASMQLKEQLFLSWNKGNNIYTCHGRARAFSKKFYSLFRFTDSSGEDAYSYLFCIHHGFKYHFASDCTVYFYLPTTYADHAKQSIRFNLSQKNYLNEFSKTWIEQQYALPRILILKSFLWNFIINPINLSVYVTLLLMAKIQTPFSKNALHNWSISQSSKRPIQGTL